MCICMCWYLLLWPQWSSKVFNVNTIAECITYLYLNSFRLIELNSVFYIFYHLNDYSSKKISLICLPWLQPCKFDVRWNMNSPICTPLILKENIQILFNATVPIRFKRVRNSQKPWFTNSTSNVQINGNGILIIQGGRDLGQLSWNYNIHSGARVNVNKCIRCEKMEYYSRRFASAMETRQT